MSRYRKLPVIVDAWKLERDATKIPEWVTEGLKENKLTWCPEGEGIYINTLEGTMYSEFGHYLIRGLAGEFYACKAVIFEASYEKLGD